MKSYESVRSGQRGSSLRSLIVCTSQFEWRMRASRKRTNENRWKFEESSVARVDIRLAIDAFARRCACVCLRSDGTIDGCLSMDSYRLKPSPRRLRDALNAWIIAKKMVIDSGVLRDEYASPRDPTMGQVSVNSLNNSIH